MHPIPTTIPPLTLEAEQTIVSALLHELNEEFGLGLSTDPDHSRTLDPDTAHDTGRTVFIGASHMRRVAAALGAAGGSVVNVCPPGWSPTKENLLAAAERVSELRLCVGDTLILDIWSNSAFLGTDDMGFPKKPEKSNTDGRFHVVGSLQAAPTAVYERLIRDAVPVLDAANTAKIVFVIPFPRYVVGKCCRDELHISNFGSSGFWSELERPATSAKQAVMSLGHKKAVFTFNIREVISDTALAEMAELEGAGASRIWANDDLVHFTAEVYLAIGKALIGAEGSDQRGQKRARLESVIAQAGPPNKRGGGNVRLPDWLSGRPGSGLEYGYGRGRGRGRGVNRVWRSARGGLRRPRRF